MILPKIPYLRLSAKPSNPRKPPEQSAVDVFYDPMTGEIVAENDQRQRVNFSSDGSGATPGFLSAFAINNSLADGVAENVLTLEIPAGTWDLQAQTYFGSTSATTTRRRMDIVNAALSPVASVFQPWVATSATQEATDITKLARVTLTEPTEYYVRVSAEFSTGAVSVVLATLEARQIA